MTKIIDTASIRENDLIAFRLANMSQVEITGIVNKVSEDGRYLVESTVGLIFVQPTEITDIEKLFYR